MTPLRLFAFLRPHYKSWNENFADEWTEAFGIREQQPFRRLDSCRKKALMLVCATAFRPDILLLDGLFDDEPPTDLVGHYQDLLQTQRDRGMILVVSTEDASRVKLVVDRTVEFSAGHVVAAHHVDVDVVLTPNAVQAERLLSSAP